MIELVIAVLIQICSLTGDITTTTTTQTTDAATGEVTTKTTTTTVDGGTGTWDDNQ